MKKEKDEQGAGRVGTLVVHRASERDGESEGFKYKDTEACAVLSY